MSSFPNDPNDSSVTTTASADESSLTAQFSTKLSLSGDISEAIPSSVSSLKPAGEAAMSTICPAILEDQAFIREDLPKAAILTLTHQFITVVIMRTPYSRVQLRVQVRT
jgi:hypothetical protein